MKICIHTVAGVFVLALLFISPGAPAQARTITDGLGRLVEVPDQVDRVICSGPGCLRLLTYLGGQESVVAVDSLEAKPVQADARPYALANPGYRRLPVFGEARGMDSAERILTLDPRPQVIFKTFTSMGQHPEILQQRTGIPVVGLGYGNLTGGRAELDRTLLIMAEVLGRRERAGEVVRYLDRVRDDLAARAQAAPTGGGPQCYVGGLAMRGGHGLQSTDPDYAPFSFVSATNAAQGVPSIEAGISHASVAKEQIVAWDPDIIFLDLSTLSLGTGGGGLLELKQDLAYQDLRAARSGRVYGLLPCNYYAQNFDCVLANAYFIGKLLYPDRFRDVDPAAKADEIFTFLVGGTAFNALRDTFKGLVFVPVPLD